MPFQYPWNTFTGFEDNFSATFVKDSHVLIVPVRMRLWMTRRINTNRIRARIALIH